jgi:hypothetical protein
MKTLTADINLDEEVAHVADFLGLKWTPINDIHAVIREIRDTALHAARGWFDGHALWELAGQLEDERKLLLEQSLELGPDSCAHYYDALAGLLDQVGLTANRIAEAGVQLDGRWDFGQRSRAVARSVTSKYPQLVGAHPAGWDAMVWVQPCGPGWEDVDPEADRALFKGAGVIPGYSTDLPSSVSIHLVRLRGTRASTQLIDAMFAHFLAIAKFLNTEKLKHDLAAALPRLREPVMLFERDDVKTDNPFLKVAFELARPPYTKAQFEESLDSAAAFEALSDDEKAKKQAEVEAELMDSISRINRAAEDKQFAEEAAQCLALLVAAFSAKP